MDLFKTSSYSFLLPEELIATEPLAARAASRLLVVRKESRTFEHLMIKDLPNLLSSNYSIVANNTQVFKARLLGNRLGTGGKVEFFLLKNLGENLWQGLMKTGARVYSGFQFEVQGKNGESTVGEVLTREESTAGAIYTAKFSKDPLDCGVGEVPLPPYIMAKRDALADDELEKYNTAYASRIGSVAAPTAGRHFTPELIERLKQKGIDWTEITLHVGMGTFKPVGVPDIRNHEMHAEWTELSVEVANRLNLAKESGKRILSIGTTTTRTLEGRAIQTPKGFRLEAGDRDVNLFIHPANYGHFRFVDSILTNFHLPESTLFMMMAAFLGDLAFLHEIYQAAIKEKYRFYSYGDAMLIL